MSQQYNKTLKIRLENTGKQFNHTWIYKNINAEFCIPHIYGITGSNGSGKSTFLKMLAGYYTPTKGEIFYEFKNKTVNRDEIFNFLSFTAPYISLHEEFNIKETFDFHAKFKNSINGLNTSEILEISGLELHKNKALKEFSSGMQQRVKLCLSLLFDTPLLLLDEPCSHLDKASYLWFFNLLEKYSKNRLVIIASNEEAELKMCTERFDIEKNSRATR